MPLKKKSKIVENKVDEDENNGSSNRSSSISDDSGDDLEDNLDTCDEVIKVDFEGRNAIESDFHGIRQLLQQLLPNTNINLAELSNKIIDQNFMGSVIKQCIDDDDMDDDDECDSDDNMDDSNTVFGITTVINLSLTSDIGCIRELRKHIIEKAKQFATNETVKFVKDILNDNAKHVGLLINERFVNIPPQISVPSFENLLKEMSRAIKKKKPFKFSYYVMFVKFYRSNVKKMITDNNNDDTENNDDTGNNDDDAGNNIKENVHQSTGKNKKKLKKKQKSQIVDDIYANGEEEIFNQEAIMSFEYGVQMESESVKMSDSWSESDDDLIPYRRVLIFDAEKLTHIIDTIKDFIE